MNSPRKLAVTCCAGVLLVACSAPAGPEGSGSTEVRVPITITRPEQGPIQRTVVLNATAQYLRKNAVRSTVTGRVEHMHVAIGEAVKAGQVLYVIRTKEADALDAIAAKDSTFQVRGQVTIVAPSSGTVVQVDKQAHDYVSDGDQLAVIADAASSVFVVNVPYALQRSAKVGMNCTVQLPDSTKVPCTITTRLATMDIPSQTQSFVVTPSGGQVFPEGLVGTLPLVLEEHVDAWTVPAACINGNEEMTRFWVMRLIDDSTAVKLPIERGIVENDRVEVLAPPLNAADRLVLTGGYGLGDTAHVSLPQR